jgi:two-component system NtrC family sensor kinase
VRLGIRIGFYIAITAILPLLFLAFAASEVAGRQVEARIVDYQVEAARALGAVITRQLADTQRVLVQQVTNFRLDVASDSARSAFLVATYRLFPEISVAVLVDGDGAEIAPALYQAEGEPVTFVGHDAVSPRRLATFRASSPAPSATPGGVLVGGPYTPEGASAAVIPMVFTWGDDIALAVEVSLAPIASRMSSLAEEREVCLIGPGGAVLLRAGQPGLVDPAAARVLLGNEGADLRYTTADGVAVLAALSRVPEHDTWAVMVAEPADAVANTVYQIQVRTGFVGAVALLLALIGGFFLTRSITEPVLRLRDATTAVGTGDYSRRAHVLGRDELAELGLAFDGMASSLEQNAKDLAEKSAEIEKFNQELQGRVERRTAQLREAQSRLVQSGQLAAVGELSAGIAHELNNPIAGVLGIVQILKAQLAGRPEAALLGAAESEAIRCKEIVANLLRFTEGEAAAADATVDLVLLVHDVVTLAGGTLRQRGVTVELDLGTPLPVRGDSSQLARALGQLLTSIRGIAGEGARLRISGTVPPVRSVSDTQPRAGVGEVELHFALSATVPTRDDWRAAGLGFWVARQVLQEHSATLEDTEGEPGGRREWTLRAPRADA